MVCWSSVKHSGSGHVLRTLHRHVTLKCISGFGDGAECDTFLTEKVRHKVKSMENWKEFHNYELVELIIRQVEWWGNALKRRPNTPICIVNAITAVCKARRSRQRVTQTGQAVESCLEVDGVAYMPGVYKVPMVRMRNLTNLRMYESKPLVCRNVYPSLRVRVVK